VGFVRGQQPELREYLALAWNAHCDREGVEKAAKCLKGKRCGECGYCQWYGDVLEAATGHRSTTECDAGRDYDFFMRDLEEIHGMSLKWSLRAFRGDAKRILHDVQKLCADNLISEEYLQRIGATKLKLARLPELHLLTKEQLATIRIAVKQHVTRGLVAKAHHNPQKSRKTGKAKSAQVDAWNAVVDAELHAAADAAEEVGDPDWSVP
jgi:hypothetical protein